MPTGWSQIISPYAAVYAPGASIYNATWAVGASIYNAFWLKYANGQPIFDSPINTEAPVVTGTASVGETLSCSTGVWSGDEPIAYTYLWIRTGAGPISGATNSTYQVQAGDLGYTLYCQVTGTNDYGSGVAQSNTTTTVNWVAPINTVLPVISGTTIVGNTLSVTDGTWTSATTITSYTYQWKRNGSNIGSATASTYLLAAADLATVITCTVTATNGGGSTPATSAGTSAITENAPVNTVAPAATGYIYYGIQLSCTTGTWTSASTPTYGYQWTRNGSDIGGATSSTYTVVGADEGQSIYCRVTATNTAGGTSQISNALTSWVPSALSPTLWLDANYAPNINSGSPANNDPVSTWIDRSANAVSYTQGTSSKRPTYKTNIQNGKPALLFDSSNNQQLTESTIQTTAQNAAFTVVIVYQVTSFPTQYRYFFNSNSSNSSEPSMGFSTNAGYLNAFFGDDVSAAPWKVFRMSTISNTTNPHALTIFYNGSGANTVGNFSANIESSALTITSVSGNNGTAATNIVGSYLSSTSHGMNGYIEEFMIFPSVVSGANLTSLQTYISQKWGI